MGLNQSGALVFRLTLLYPLSLAVHLSLILLLTTLLVHTAYFQLFSFDHFSSRCSSFFLLIRWQRKGCLAFMYCIYVMGLLNISTNDSKFLWKRPAVLTSKWNESGYAVHVYRYCFRLFFIKRDAKTTGGSEKLYEGTKFLLYCHVEDLLIRNASSFRYQVYLLFFLKIGAA